MGGSKLRLAALSIVRVAVASVGAYLVRWGFLDHDLMQDAASVVAFLVVDRAWEFYLLHKEDLYQRWLLLLGLDAQPYSSKALIVEEARHRVNVGMRPDDD